VLKILLNAGKSPNLGFAYDLFFLVIIIIYVKIAMTRGQSAGVRSIHTSDASQRLHAGDLLYAYLVGPPLSLFQEREGAKQVCLKVTVILLLQKKVNI
jgi:hypothetical protein